MADEDKMTSQRPLFFMVFHPLLVLVLLSATGLATAPRSTPFNEGGCSYSFNVWHPDQDMLRQMKEMQFKYDNFTAHVQGVVARIKVGLLEELRRIQNETGTHEKELLRMRVEGMQGKLHHSELTTEVTNLRRNVDSVSRKVDEVEVEYYNLRNQVKTNEVVEAGDKLLVGKDLLTLLKNTVGDLKAEWLLMKRELEGMRVETRAIRHVQEGVHNDTAELRETVTAISKETHSLGPRHTSDVGSRKLEDKIAGLSEDLGAIRQSQAVMKVDISVLTTQVSNLQTSSAALQQQLQDLQVENARQREKLDARNEDRRRRGPPVSGSQGETAPTQQQDAQPRDCHELHAAGHIMSGVYEIKPDGWPNFVRVYCQMTNSTGYTLLQRRIDGLLNFNRRWLEYRFGFGNPYGEFWVGNDMISTLSHQKQYVLRVDLWDWEGRQAFAEYSTFSVEGEEAQYRLHVGGYFGNAGDSLSVHDNMAFSTEDVDNDLHTRHCAAENKGGWWFNSCYSCHLNGVYRVAWYSQAQSSYADGVTWYTWKGSEFYSLKMVEMKIRPLVP